MQTKILKAGIASLTEQQQTGNKISFVRFEIGDAVALNFDPDREDVYGKKTYVGYAANMRYTRYSNDGVIIKCFIEHDEPLIAIGNVILYTNNGHGFCLSYSENPFYKLETELVNTAAGMKWVLQIYINIPQLTTRFSFDNLIEETASFRLYKHENAINFPFGELHDQATIERYSRTGRAVPLVNVKNTWYGSPFVARLDDTVPGYRISGGQTGDNYIYSITVLAAGLKTGYFFTAFSPTEITLRLDVEVGYTSYSYQGYPISAYRSISLATGVFELSGYDIFVDKEFYIEGNTTYYAYQGYTIEARKGILLGTGSYESTVTGIIANKQFWISLLQGDYTIIGSPVVTSYVESGTFLAIGQQSPEYLKVHYYPSIQGTPILPDNNLPGRIFSMAFDKGSNRLAVTHQGSPSATITGLVLSIYDVDIDLATNACTLTRTNLIEISTATGGIAKAISAYRVLWSPDGSQLILLVRDPSFALYILDTTTWSIIATPLSGQGSGATNFTGYPGDMAFSPDGTTLAITISNAGSAAKYRLHLLDTNTWTRQTGIEPIISLRSDELKYSPDGTKLAIMPRLLSLSTNPLVKLYNTIDMSPITIPTPTGIGSNPLSASTLAWSPDSTELYAGLNGSSVFKIAKYSVGPSVTLTTVFDNAGAGYTPAGEAPKILLRNNTLVSLGYGPNHIVRIDKDTGAVIQLVSGITVNVVCGLFLE